MIDGCTICGIIAVKEADDERLISQTAHWRIELDHNQQFLGKIFVTSLAHVGSLSELGHEQWDDFSHVVGLLEPALTKLFQPSHFNWSCLMNDDAMTGKPTHVHWHLHPRYDGPVTVNSEIFEDTKWRPRNDLTNHIVTDETFTFLTQAIKGAL